MKEVAVVVVPLLGLLLACQPPSSASPVPTARSLEVVPLDGSVSDVAWGEGELVAFVSDPDQVPSRTRLGSIDVSTFEEMKINLELGGCVDDMFLSPRLENGVLRFARVCFPNGPIALMERTADGDVTTLVEDIGFPPNGYVSPDDGQTWIASDASGFCSWISRVHGSGGPWPITIDGGSRPFEVDEGLVAPDCDRTGHASRIAQSPDGKLALLAAPSAVDLSGTSRFDMPWNIYTVDADGKPQVLAPGFVRPTELQWTTAGDALAVAAQRDGRSGLWSISQDGGVTLLLDGEIIAFSWEAGDRRVAIIEPVGPAGPDRTYRLSLVELGA